MPPGAAQSHEQPMVEKSVADGLATELAAARAEVDRLRRQFESSRSVTQKFSALVNVLQQHIAAFHRDYNQIADGAYAAGQQEQIEAIERIIDKHMEEA